MQIFVHSVKFSKINKFCFAMYMHWEQRQKITLNVKLSTLKVGIKFPNNVAKY